MRSLGNYGRSVIAFLILSLWIAAESTNLPAQAATARELNSIRFTMNVNDTDLRTVLQMIATRTGLNLILDHEPSVTLSIREQDISAKELLDQISSDQNLEYSVSGNDLTITRRRLGAIGSGRTFPINLKYANAAEVQAQLKSVLGAEERSIIDERSNSIIFLGSLAGFNRVQELVALLDVAPKQIAIEAQIVETSSNFLRDLGVAVGVDANSRNLSIKTQNGNTSSRSWPLMVSGLLAGTPELEFRLAAAETKGEAKIISRPKVVTLNNRQAHIQSGESFSVRTLSSTTGSPIGSGGAATGGAVTAAVTRISAGLSLDILPSIVGNNQIRMTVDINNSQTDPGLIVDGIPGIRNNSASTAVMVKNGQTAIIAGLIKQTNHNNHNMIPVLSEIPLIGVLFRSFSTSNENNELVIFITPTIDQDAVSLPAPMEAQH